jgi:hypothetical protein
MGYLLTKLCAFNTFCGEYLQSCYLRGSNKRKRTLKMIGLYYPSPTCDYIFEDFVELEYMEMEGD